MYKEALIPTPYLDYDTRYTFRALGEFCKPRIVLQVHAHLNQIKVFKNQINIY